MKKPGLIVMMLVIGVSVMCASCIVTIVPIIGSGQMVTSERAVSSFKKVNGSGSVRLHYYESQEYRAVVTVDSNLEEYVDIYTKNETLYIKTKSRKGRSFSFTRFEVDIYCPVVTAVSMSGSGSFKCMDPITTSSFELDISGSGKMEGTLYCVNFDSSISGSGKIAVNGSSDNLSITISGSGNFEGDKFNTNNAAVHVSGSGKMKIRVAHYLKATISGSGEVQYYGNPIIDSRITGSGRIKKM